MQRAVPRSVHLHLGSSCQATSVNIYIGTVHNFRNVFFFTNNLNQSIWISIYIHFQAIRGTSIDCESFSIPSHSHPKLKYKV